MWKKRKYQTLRDEHELLERISQDRLPKQSLFSTGLSGKNRYENIVPLEETRVKLSPIEGVEGSDYINANFILNKSFIAAQAPIFSTFGDFWRMVWEQRVCVIVMLTRLVEMGKQKANIYWPLYKGIPVVFNDLSIVTVQEFVYPSIIVREFLIQKNGEKRMVYHLNFKAWPDFGIPQSTKEIRDLIVKTNQYKASGSAEGMDGPIVVHCSGGVGRSGTFIALCHLLKLLESNLPVNVMDTVLTMRSQRWGMVQTEKQYEFIYRVLEDHANFYRSEVLRTCNQTWRHLSQDNLPNHITCSETQEQE